MEFKLLSELSRWMHESTSNLSPTSSDVEDGDDLEAGPIDDQVLPNNIQDPAIDEEEESNLLDLVEENESPEVKDDDQTSVANLPRKRKFYFYIFYCIFVILYVVLVLVTACTYPLKPEYNINSFHVHVNESNYTEEMKQSVYFTLDNRNKLTSALYDDINITMLYVPSPDTNIYFASTIIPGFDQHILKPKKLEFHMPAPGLTGLLKEDLIEKDFRVILEFTVKFHCKFLCKHKHHFLIVHEIEYSQ